MATFTDIPFKIREQLPATHRVVVNQIGYAVPPSQAWSDHAVLPEVVLVRNDGWTLATPWRFFQTALEMWKDEWLEIVTVDRRNTPI